MRKAAAPVGIGWWLWYVEQARHGWTPTQLAQVCRANGIDHILVKTADGTYSGGSWADNRAAVPALRAAGLKVYSWSYNMDGGPAEAETINAVLRATPFDGHVFDIEAECEGKAAAIEFMWQIVRTAFPDLWLGYAPLPWPDHHDPALYVASNKYADAVMPQFYWGELGPYYGDLDRLFTRWDEWQVRWAAQGGPTPELLPIGQACGNVTTDEIARFVRLCQDRHIAACSFWEWANSTTEQWSAVASAAQTWALAIPTPAPKSAYQFELGFADYAVAHAEVGQADGPMTYDKWGNAFQDTTTGKLVWWKKANVTEFHAA